MSMQMLYPQSGWVDLCPALAAGQIKQTMHSLETWDMGRLPSDARLYFPVLGMRKPVLIRELMGIPMTAWQNMAGHILGKAVNARALAHSSCVGLPHVCLQLIGRDTPLLLSSVMSFSAASLPMSMLNAECCPTKFDICL